MAQGTPAGSGPHGLRRWLPLLLILVLVAAFFLLGLQNYISLASLRTHHAWLARQVAEHLPLALLAYMLVYAAVVVAATVGATLIFLAARTAMGDSLRRRAGPWLQRLQAGFQADAFSYLLFLRLVPLFPFFVVNLVPAFLGVRLRSFVLATLIGIIPATFIFATFGAGLGDLLAQNGEITLSQVLSPRFLTALAGLALLALLPVIYRHWRHRQKPGAGEIE